jgi:hypothetical protein
MESWTLIPVNAILSIMTRLSIINAESVNDEDGPYEVFDEVYENVDRTDLVAMMNLAAKLNEQFDGRYVVWDGVAER